MAAPETGGGGTDGAERKRGGEGAAFFPGQKGGRSAVPSSPAALGHQSRGGPPFLGTPDLCNPRRLPRWALPPSPLHGPLGAAPVKLCRVFPPLCMGQCTVLVGRSMVGRSVGQSVVPAGWGLLEVITRPSPKPCRPHAGLSHSQTGPAHSRFTKRTFMNKGNSTILRRCQKVNQILRKSFCAPGPQPPAAEWPLFLRRAVQHSWSPGWGL